MVAVRDDNADRFVASPSAGIRLFLIHGDTHIDPPAAAIAVMATLIVVPTVLFA